jgi:hypothetical protein
VNAVGGAHSRPGEPRTSRSLPHAWGRRPSVRTEPRTPTTAAAPLHPITGRPPCRDASSAASPSSPSCLAPVGPEAEQDRRFVCIEPLQDAHLHNGVVRNLGLPVGARGSEPLASSASRNARHLGLPAETANAQVRGSAPCTPLPSVAGVVLPICYPREDDDVTWDRLVEIAELLGVTKQRAHQIAEQKGFRAPLAEDARGRVESRYEVQAWAKRRRTEKPWRRGAGR